MVDIVFINPPYERVNKDFSFVKTIANNSPSLGLLHLAAQVREDGFTPHIIECDIENMTLDEVAEEVLQINPKFVGITLFTVGVENASIIAKLIKDKKPDLPILVGGPHMSSMGMETMKRYPQFDVSVLHEGEQVISILMKAIEKKQPLDLLQGIIFKTNDTAPFEYKQTAPATIQVDLDRLPLPAWDLLPDFPKKYPLAVFDYPQGPVATFSASRGCPFKCAFCDTSTFGSKIRYYSPQKVYEIMKYLQDTYGIKHIQFVDDLFVANKKIVGELCDIIVENNLKMTWSCTARVDTINEKILSKMKAAGCWEISFGLESGSDRMLKEMKKVATVEVAERAVTWTHAAGIRVKGLFMLGYPGETEESIEQTREFINRVPLSTMNMSKFTPYPGTPIYYELYGTAMRDEDWERMNGMNFIYESELSIDYLDKSYKETLENFYKKPEFLKHYLSMGTKYPRHLGRLSKFLFGLVKSKILRKKQVV